MSDPTSSHAAAPFSGFRPSAVRSRTRPVIVAPADAAVASELPGNTCTSMTVSRATTALATHGCRLPHTADTNTVLRDGTCAEYRPLASVWVYCIEPRIVIPGGSLSVS